MLLQNESQKRKQNVTGRHTGNVDSEPCSLKVFLMCSSIRAEISQHMQLSNNILWATAQTRIENVKNNCLSAPVPMESVNWTHGIPMESIDGGCRENVTGKHETHFNENMKNKTTLQHS